ncbi:MAG: fructose-6-phosphate aldolase [Candidatus Diapherotrites archaeon]|nr:fructose-6-phosphate aldolase [Candidatus Diapherotrites archaeon]
MEFFIDTANLEQIKKAKELGLVQGVTTNPSLAAKEGVPFIPRLKEICAIVKGPVSAEVISLNAEGMIKEALELSKIALNVVIKIPMTEEGMKAVQILSEKKIKTNVTLVFTANQALLAAKAGATYVSPFVGRLDDLGEDGMKVIEEIMQVYKNYGFKTKVIVASVRSVEHVKRSAMIGADIATIPFKVLEEMYKHDLTDKGIQKFLDDWKKLEK